MLMYNLIVSGNLWQYCKDIPAGNNNGDIFHFNGDSFNFKTTSFNTNDSFNFKSKINGQTSDSGTKEVQIMVPLKYLSNFWRTLEMPLINCEIHLILTRFANYVIV